jgi:hypothetical protein
MSEDLIVAMVRELDELRAAHPTIMFSIDPADAFNLIGALQLVLRHPDLPETTRDVAERVKTGLARAIATTPALAAVVRMGDDPTFDR